MITWRSVSSTTLSVRISIVKTYIGTAHHELNDLRPDVACRGVDGLEAEIQSVGKTIADAERSAPRHAMRALDDKAMDMASRDAELRAALFRLVDVTPAAALARRPGRHLWEFLERSTSSRRPLDRR